MGWNPLEEIKKQFKRDIAKLPGGEKLVDVHNKVEAEANRAVDTAKEAVRDAAEDLKDAHGTIRDGAQDQLRIGMDMINGIVRGGIPGLLNGIPGGGFTGGMLSRMLPGGASGDLPNLGGGVLPNPTQTVGNLPSPPSIPTPPDIREVVGAVARPIATGMQRIFGGGGDLDRPMTDAEIDQLVERARIDHEEGLGGVIGNFDAEAARAGWVAVNERNFPSTPTTDNEVSTPSTAFLRGQIPNDGARAINEITEPLRSIDPAMAERLRVAMESMAAGIIPGEPDTLGPSPDTIGPSDNYARVDATIQDLERRIAGIDNGDMSVQSPYFSKGLIPDDSRMALDASRAGMEYEGADKNIQARQGFPPGHPQNPTGNEVFDESFQAGMEARQRMLNGQPLFPSQNLSDNTYRVLYGDMEFEKADPAGYTKLSGTLGDHFEKGLARTEADRYQAVMPDRYASLTESFAKHGSANGAAQNALNEANEAIRRAMDSSREVVASASNPTALTT